MMKCPGRARFLCGLLLVVGGRAVPANAEDPVVFRAALSHTAFSRSFPDTLALKIDLAAAVDKTTERRPPLNLALVIDRSGSMADEGKIEYAMEAARLVVENLSERDIVSLIAFNHEAVVLSPAGLALNKEFLDHRLDEITTEGWTNLSAGLLEAFAQIDRQTGSDHTKRVIVLTDGQANRGVTDPKRLRRLVESARRRNIGVSTMGCGEAFDEKVLIALAEAGGGRYTYIRRSEEIPEAMSAELNGLLGVVAQNVTIEVVAPEALHITAVHGWPLEQPAESFTFDLGDVREGEHTVLLLRLAARDFLAGEVVRIDCVLSFDRTDLGVRRRQVARVEVVALKDDDDGLIRRSADQAVVLYADIVDAAERAEDAVLGLDDAGLRDAAELFERHYEKACRYAVDAGDQQLLNQSFMLKHFMTELSEAAETGRLHGHADARRRLSRDVEYRRYLRRHHGHSD